VPRVPAPVKPRDVHLLLSPHHYKILERMAYEKGIQSVSTFIRMILVEHLQLPYDGEIFGIKE